MAEGPRTCRCGDLGDPRKERRCNSRSIQRYRARLSGPLLDRIDLHVEAPAVAYKDLAGGPPGGGERGGGGAGAGGAGCAAAAIWRSLRGRRTRRDGRDAQSWRCSHQRPRRSRQLGSLRRPRRRRPPDPRGGDDAPGAVRARRFSCRRPAWRRSCSGPGHPNAGGVGETRGRRGRRVAFLETLRILGAPRDPRDSLRHGGRGEAVPLPGASADRFGAAAVGGDPGHLPRLARASGDGRGERPARPAGDAGAARASTFRRPGSTSPGCTVPTPSARARRGRGG